MALLSNQNRVILVSITILALLAFDSSSGSSIENVLDLKTKISKLIVNNRPESKTIDLFIAAKNHLYKIVDRSVYFTNQTGINRDSFKVDIDLVTGPKLQKQQCAFIVESSQSGSTQCIKYICDEDSSGGKLNLHSSKQRLIDYENRLLLIDAKNEHLIECGTIDYGGCRLRHLSDLSIIGCNYSAPVSLKFDNQIL